MINIFAKKRNNEAADAGASSGSLNLNSIMQNKTAIALIVILILAAYFVMQGTFQAGGSTTTTAPPSNIKTETQAGDTISDLGSAAVEAGSILKDIDNSIG